NLPYSHGTALSIQRDNRILVEGTSGPADGPRHVVVLRLRADGTRDATFGTGGTVVPSGVDPGTGLLNPGGLGLQPDGRILVAGDEAVDINSRGSWVQRAAVVRLRTDGTPDPTFHSAPDVLETGEVNAMAV